MIAPFFAPDAFSSSARSGSRAVRISCAAVPTDSISRGARRRSSRVAVWRTSSRSRFGSSPATFFARSGKIAPASVRASSSDGMTWSSAQFESPRAQNSSSSSNPLSLPAER